MPVIKAKSYSASVYSRNSSRVATPTAKVNSKVSATTTKSTASRIVESTAKAIGGTASTIKQTTDSVSKAATKTINTVKQEATTAYNSAVNTVKHTVDKVTAQTTDIANRAYERTNEVVSQVYDSTVNTIKRVADNFTERTVDIASRAHDRTNEVVSQVQSGMNDVIAMSANTIGHTLYQKPIEIDLYFSKVTVSSSVTSGNGNIMVNTSLGNNIGTIETDLGVSSQNGGLNVEATGNSKELKVGLSNKTNIHGQISVGAELTSDGKASINLANSNEYYATNLSFGQRGNSIIAPLMPKHHSLSLSLTTNPTDYNNTSSTISFEVETNVDRLALTGALIGGAMVVSKLAASALGQGLLAGGSILAGSGGIAVAAEEETQPAPIPKPSPKPMQPLASINSGNQILSAY
ncbi:hypothetical protein [Alkaliphilus serpentinus]|uniref:Uncharacterized protein n=1 Tax=Alkaliphilus serpentinus TaxID=1482731 RepID=A0A833HNC5_9FIRM|nr:hypothetical protein [Alkaliphilus serpentinus]KAB3529250.1 hypothetical protein F8153_09590 [Alkaliphilus serpentinus]